MPCAPSNPVGGYGFDSCAVGGRGVVVANIRGTEDDDVLAGKPGEGNVILGLGGDDTLTGGNLADSIDGGDGADLILSGGGAGNVLIGGAGDDTLIGLPDYEGMVTYNRLDGGDGADHITGGVSDTLVGGSGDDTIEAAYRAQIDAGSGNDIIDVGLLDSTIDGGDGIDRLVATERLSLAVIKNVEILAVDGWLSASVAELQQFSSIRAADPDVRFSIGVSGSIDLSAKLGTTSIDLSTGADSARLVTGGGDDRIGGSYGGEYWFDGGAGNDTLDGLDSDVTLIGGAGADELVTTGGDTFSIDGGTGDDVIRVASVVTSGVVTGGTGYDTLIASGDITKARITGVEELSSDSPLTATAAQFESFQKISTASFQGYADLVLAQASVVDLAEELGEGDASLTGSDGADSITTGAGDDTLIGGDGNDTVHGGAGSDLLIVESGSDHVFGDAGDDVITLGRFGANVVDGGDGTDLLAVSQSGGPVDLSSSTITNVETLRVNTATMRATAAQFDSFDAIVTDFSRLELQLVGGGKMDLSDELRGKAVTVIGSSENDTIRTGAGADTIIGGKGDDRLDGSAGKDSLLGGDGVDTLYGGEGVDRLDGEQGGDVYVVDAVGDRIEDSGRKGDDQVESSISFSLGGSIENLKLTGSENIDGAGNAGDNVLIGNSSDNRLDGGGGDDTLDGGEGSDRLDGGHGGDLYIVHDAADRINDTGSKGTDVAASSVTLELSKSIENLKLTGAADIDGAGNSGANVLSGNSGDNRLDGGGAADTLKGGAGDDVFLFSDRLGDNKVDQIVDFGDGADQIGLDRDVFAALAKGAFKDSAFKDISAGAVDGDDRILYDAKGGKLFYDQDGSGQSKAVLFAVLKGEPELSSADFLIL